MSTVSREIVGAVPCLDDVGQQANHDATMHRVRVPWTIRDRIGDEGVAALGEEGLICHGRGT
jgi:hypothetical protein